MSAFVTASRAGGPAARPRRTCDGSCTGATSIPAASSAGVYGAGPPGSQPSTDAPAHAARSAAADAPAPAAPTTWIRSPGTIGRAVARGRQAGPDVGGRADRHPAPTRSSSISSAARAESRLFSVRSPGHWKRRTDGSPSPATAT